MDMSILFKTAFKGFKNNEKIRINSTKSTNNEVNL